MGTAGAPEGSAGPDESRLFAFVQIELPRELDPADGRYLIRPDGSPPDAPPAHVLVLQTVGASPRRRFARRSRPAGPAPEPPLLPLTRVTVVTAAPLPDRAAAAGWLAAAGEAEVAAGLRVVNRALSAQRIAAAEPYPQLVRRRDAVLTRVGFGTGEAVAGGQWSQARELSAPPVARRRLQPLEPQSRLAALLGGKSTALACEELALRARLDLETARPRLAALELANALELAVAELSADPGSAALAERITELRGLRHSLAHLFDAALRGELPVEGPQTLDEGLGRLEAALRARAAARF